MKCLPSLAQMASFGLGGLVVAGAVLRWGSNNVRRFGNGDEYHYRLEAEAIFTRGWAHFPELVRWHLSDEPDFPAPYRWGVLLFNRLACAVRQVCDERSLAWVSTLSGILVVTLVALLAQKLFTRRTAVVATALAVTSPLHLELGRRAYADELHTALVLLSFLALANVAIFDTSSTSALRRYAWLGVSLVSLTLAWSVKESVAFMVPALAIWLWALRSPRRLKWQDGLLLSAPAGLSVLGFGLLNHGFSGLCALFEATRLSLLHPYSIAFQAGPPHRPLVELFTLSPVVFAMLPVVPFAAWGAMRPGDGAAISNSTDNRAKVLALAFLLLLGMFAFLPKNLRFYAILDPLARLLVAWLVCEILPVRKLHHALWCAALMLGNSAFELAVFHRTFVVSAVTDPTASAIFGALQMIPSAARPWHPTALVTFCAVGSVGLAWAAARAAGFSKKSMFGATAISLASLMTPQMLRPQKGVADTSHARDAFRASGSMSPSSLDRWETR